MLFTRCGYLILMMEMLVCYDFEVAIVLHHGALGDKCFNHVLLFLKKKSVGYFISSNHTSVDRFYGNGKCILSAGQDRAFRLFSVVQVTHCL